MFLLDDPYVSEFLKQSVRELGLPVLATDAARRLAGDDELDFIDAIDFAARMGKGERLYANSENGLEHIFKCGCSPELARQIDICKDKALFRETIASLHQDYPFQRVSIDDLAELNVSGFDCPFIVKPARGFFSLGVHVVKSHSQWPEIVRAIHEEREALNAEYPEEVVNSGEFIVEAGINGEEYAIDLYYDEEGSPVITNILHHHFMSDDDTSDRLYYTSAGIIRDRLKPFTEYVTRMGEACDFRSFPMHLEVRVTGSNEIIPIEANPMRFAGWCVADITHHAWDINPYEYYFQNKQPDWGTILKGRKGEATVMVIADFPEGTEREQIAGFNYDGFQKLFDNILELRKIDYSSYPVFAFCFARMEESEVDNLKSVLTEDFSRFVLLDKK